MEVREDGRSGWCSFAWRLHRNLQKRQKPIDIFHPYIPRSYNNSSNGRLHQNQRTRHQLIVLDTPAILIAPIQLVFLLGCTTVASCSTAATATTALLPHHPTVIPKPSAAYTHIIELYKSLYRQPCLALSRNFAYSAVFACSAAPAAR